MLLILLCKDIARQLLTTLFLNIFARWKLVQVRLSSTLMKCVVAWHLKKKIKTCKTTRPCNGPILSLSLSTHNWQLLSVLVLELVIFVLVVKRVPYVFVAGSRSEVIASAGRVATLLAACMLAFKFAAVGGAATVMVRKPRIRPFLNIFMS